MYIPFQSLGKNIYVVISFWAHNNKSGKKNDLIIIQLTIFE